MNRFERRRVREVARPKLRLVTSHEPAGRVVDLPPETVARALTQVLAATPQMIAAVEKLREELDLLCLPQPTTAAIWRCMIGAWLTHHGPEASR